MTAHERWALSSLVGVALLAMGAITPARAQSSAQDVAQEFPDYAFVCPDGRYQSGCDSEIIEAAVKLEESSPSDFGEHCLYKTRADCKVTANGRINREFDAPALHWQLLSLRPTDGPQTEMLVLAELDGQFFHLLFAGQVDGYFDTPIAVDDAGGDGKSRFILHIPALNRGLGNADIVLFTSGEGWNWTDATSLMRQADKLLPQGFATASPVNFNFHEATAFAPVRRDGDAGCCPTGGASVFDFEQSDHTLAVSAISFTETKPVGEAQSFSAGSISKDLSGGDK